MSILLYIILGIAVVIVLLALIAPKQYDVSRSIEIAKPKAEVFEYLKYLKKQQQWSPWARRDPQMLSTYKGIDGEVGAINSWKGNKQVGEGEQEIINIIDGKRIDSELRFLKPFKSTSDSYLELSEAGIGRTKVSWGFKGKNKFPMSIMMLFMNMDKAVGKDFEEGLQRLKTILESNEVPEASRARPTEEETPR